MYKENYSGRGGVSGRISESVSGGSNYVYKTVKQRDPNPREQLFVEALFYSVLGLIGMTILYFIIIYVVAVIVQKKTGCPGGVLK